MLAVRKSHHRGHIDHGWLDTYHTFSFGSYQDPKHMGFRALRVINEDRVAAGQGFGMHGHRDMEIVTYVLAGELAHRDSLGHTQSLRPGEVQRMTAGSGIRHSEFNPSHTESVHLYQIWLLPREANLQPSYEQRPFDVAGRRDRWQLVASPDGAESSVTIEQDARIHLADLTAGKSLAFPLSLGRHAWLQVLRGTIEVNHNSLTAGDGAAVSDELQLEIHASTNAEAMLFDLD